MTHLNLRVIAALELLISNFIDTLLCAHPFGSFFVGAYVCVNRIK